MTMKQQVGWLVTLGIVWVADSVFQPSLSTRVSLGFLVAAFLFVLHDLERGRERREIMAAVEGKADTVIEALREIATALRIAHDPEAARIAAAFGYEAALTFPRRTDFYDYEEYLEALKKLKAALPNDIAPAES